LVDVPCDAPSLARSPQPPLSDGRLRGGGGRG